MEKERETAGKIYVIGKKKKEIEYLGNEYKKEFQKAKKYKRAFKGGYIEPD